MGTDPRLLREQCERTLASTSLPALGTKIEGKVRDNYVAGDRRTIVVTDRVSCFDRVVGTLPFKGQVLNQVAAFWFVNAANSGNARAKVEEELNVGQRVFARLLEQNADKLKLSARVLAADFAFREAIATHDSRTISSVLANHGARIGADAMVFVDLDGNVVADTLRPHAQAHAFEFPALIRPGSGANAAMEVLDDRAFQLVSVPVLAPVPIGWVVMGFAVDDSLARDLRQLTELEVSFALENAGTLQVFASTLAAPEQQSLLAAIPQKSTVVSRRVLSCTTR